MVGAREDNRPAGAELRAWTPQPRSRPRPAPRAPLPWRAPPGSAAGPGPRICERPPVPPWTGTARALAHRGASRPSTAAGAIPVAGDSTRAGRDPHAGWASTGTPSLPRSNRRSGSDPAGLVVTSRPPPREVQRTRRRRGVLTRFVLQFARRTRCRDLSLPWLGESVAESSPRRLSDELRTSGPAAVRRRAAPRVPAGAEAT